MEDSTRPIRMTGEKGSAVHAPIKSCLDDRTGVRLGTARPVPAFSGSLLALSWEYGES